jgi:hypothetical protein
VNGDGNAAVTYIRAGDIGATIFPEARYSVLYGSEDDVRPGRLLHKGDYTLGDDRPLLFDPEAEPTGRLDTTGISVDGFDDTGIWMLGPYSTEHPTKPEGRWRLTVGKVFGKRYPDLQIERAQPKLAAGNLSLTLRVRNLGDGAALPTTVRLSLVSRASTRASGRRVLRLQTVKLGRVRSGRTRTLELRARLPSGKRLRGRDVLRVQLDSGRRLREYGEQNNTIHVRLPRR